MILRLRRSAHLRRRGPAAAICVLLAVLHTWPLAVHPSYLSRNDNGDAELNEWILAWVAHQLPRDPMHLFEGNIFYPAHDTLAYSEPLIVPGALAMPLWWLGGSAVLLFNVMLIAGFAATAFAGYLLIEEWTGDEAAGLVSGSALAFNTHTLTRLSHVQAAHLYGLPLALRSTDRLIAGGRARDALWLAFWMSVMAYTSGYLVVFGTIMIAVALVARAPGWLPRARVVLPRFALATVCAAIASTPVYLPYYRVARLQHMVRPLDAVKDFSATLRGYAASAGRIHMAAWSWRFFTGPIDSFFPGVIVILLAAAAVWWAFRGGDRLFRARVVMLLAIAITGVVLSLGTATPIYGWLYYAFPPMRGLRAAARFGNLFLLAAAALAGLGLAALRDRRSATDHTGPSATDHTDTHGHESRQSATDDTDAHGNEFRKSAADHTNAHGIKAVIRVFRVRPWLLGPWRPWLIGPWRPWPIGPWRPWPALAVAAVVVVNLEALRAPFVYRPFTGVPAIYKLLAKEPGPVVLAEQPFFPRWAVAANAPYVLAATAHWRPLMNGYSGYTPGSYQHYADAFWYFPEDFAVQAMKDAGVTHVMVHPQRFERDARKVLEKVEARRDMELLAIGPNGMRLYRLKR